METSMAKAFTNGQMKGPTKDNGTGTKCMARARQNGQMVDSTLEVTLMIIRVAMESSTGQTVANTKDTGAMASNMV